MCGKAVRSCFTSGLSTVRAHQKATEAHEHAAWRCAKFDKLARVRIVSHKLVCACGWMLSVARPPHAAIWMGMQCSSFVNLCLRPYKRAAENEYLGDTSRSFALHWRPADGRAQPFLMLGLAPRQQLPSASNRRVSFFRTPSRWQPCWVSRAACKPSRGWGYCGWAATHPSHCSCFMSTLSLLLASSPVPGHQTEAPRVAPGWLSPRRVRSPVCVRPCNSRRHTHRSSEQPCQRASANILLA